MTKAPRMHAVNTLLKQIGLTIFRETMLLPLSGGCALATIASAPASLIKC